MILYIDCADFLVIAGIAAITITAIAHIGLIAVLLWLNRKVKGARTD